MNTPIVHGHEPHKVRIEYKKILAYASKVVTSDGVEIDLPKLPTKSRKSDAGYDVYSAEDGVIPAGGFRNFHTGIRVACPLGWFYSVRGRSGLGFKNIQPFIGTLDATYNGELKILLLNHSTEDYNVNKGDRIAQIIFEKQHEIIPVEVEEFSDEYDVRGTSGFGDSGK